MRQNAAPMTRCAFDRLRASRRLAGWLLAWVFVTSLGAGFHLASHIAAPVFAASASPADADDSGTAASSHVDCAACRVVSGLSFALPPAAVLCIAASTLAPASPPRLPAVSMVDRAARWLQAFKHGPPLLPR